MKDIEQILQDSGIIIQPYWRKLYSHSATAVKNYGMHPTFEHRLGKVWLDEEADHAPSAEGSRAAPLARPASSKDRCG